MKKPGLLYIFVFVTLIALTQDSIVPILNEVFPAHELKSDLAFIINKAVFKRYNYNKLMFVGKVRFMQLYDSIVNVIEEKGEMTRVDFYFLTAPLINSLQDDCSYWDLNGEYYWNPPKKKEIEYAEKFVIPFSVTVFNDSVYVTSNSSEFFKSRIISINNIPAKKVVSNILESYSYKRNRYYQKNHDGGLGFYYSPLLTNELFNFHDSIEIEYSPFESENTLRKTLELLPVGNFNFFDSVRTKRLNRPWYYLNFEKDKAILRIVSLSDYEVDIFVINDIFKKIKENKSQDLIIDISSCGWSTDIFWLIMLNYLHDGEINLYEYHHGTRNLAKYTKKKIKDSNYVTGKFSDINEDFKFKGKKFLIIGVNTAGLTIKFADILTFNQIVEKSFGRETLGRTTSYSYKYTNYLPVTGIRLILSTSMTFALDKNMNSHGLLPDVEVKPETEAEFLENEKNKFVIDKVTKLLDAENIKNEDTTH